MEHMLAFHSDMRKSHSGFEIKSMAFQISSLFVYPQFSVAEKGDIEIHQVQIVTLT